MNNNNIGTVGIPSTELIVAERIARMEKTISQRDEEIMNLHKALQERDAELENIRTLATNDIPQLSTKIPSGFPQQGRASGY